MCVKTRTNCTFRDYSLTYECVDFCTQKEATCIGGCTNNSTCPYECGIEAISCKFFCPCAEGCPEVRVQNFWNIRFSQTLSNLLQRVTIARMTSARAEIMKRTLTTSTVRASTIWSTGSVFMSAVITTTRAMLTVTENTMRTLKTAPASPTVQMDVPVQTTSVRRQLQRWPRQPAQLKLALQRPSSLPLPPNKVTVLFSCWIVKEDGNQFRISKFDSSR